MPLPDQLSPTQRDAHDQLVAALPAGNIFELRSKPGRGRTTVLSSIHAAKGGAFLTVRDFVDRLNTRHPLALDEALYEVLLDALREHDCVIVDDFHVATAVTRGCGFYPRNPCRSPRPGQPATATPLGSTSPVYKETIPLKIITNAVRWLGSGTT